MLGQDARMRPIWRLIVIIMHCAATLTLALVASASGAAAVAGQARTIEGVVRYVIDGDTLVLQPDTGAGKPIKLRLLGLDAPEICQAGGIEARDAMVQRVAGRRVQATGKFEDDYHRRLVTITVDGADLGAWMVAQGHAWNAGYRHRPGPYAREERAARSAQRGLFAATDPLPPRSFRHAHGSCYPAPAP